MVEQQAATQAAGGDKKPPNQVSTTGAQPPQPQPPKQQQPIMVLRDRLLARSEELKAALAEVPVATFVRAVVTSAMLNPDILACTWQSVWMACLRACRDGLLPDGIEAALVPYKSTCTYIPMYRGQVRQFMRSGLFRWIKADLVREHDEFANWVDENGEHFKHVPQHDFSAKIVKVYAAAMTSEGAFFCAVMSISEADKIKAMSRNTRDDAPWKNWPEEMYKKTGLRRLAKLLPTARDAVPLLGDEDSPPDLTALAIGTDGVLPADQPEPDSTDDTKDPNKGKPDERKTS